MELVAFFAYRIVSVSISTRIAASLVISGASAIRQADVPAWCQFQPLLQHLWHGMAVKEDICIRHKEKEERKTVFIKQYSHLSIMAQF